MSRHRMSQGLSSWIVASRPAEAGIFSLFDQQRFDPRRRDLFDAAQEFFYRAELGDQLHCGFLTDAFHAGNIVRSRRP